MHFLKPTCESQTTLLPPSSLYSGLCKHTKHKNVSSCGSLPLVDNDVHTSLCMSVKDTNMAINIKARNSK